MKALFIIFTFTLFFIISCEHGHNQKHGHHDHHSDQKDHRHHQHHHHHHHRDHHDHRDNDDDDYDGDSDEGEDDGGEIFTPDPDDEDAEIHILENAIEDDYQEVINDITQLIEDESELYGYCQDYCHDCYCNFNELDDDRKLTFKRALSSYDSTSNGAGDDGGEMAGYCNPTCGQCLDYDDWYNCPKPPPPCQDRKCPCRLNCCEEALAQVQRCSAECRQECDQRRQDVGNCRRCYDRCIEDACVCRKRCDYEKCTY